MKNFLILGLLLFTVGVVANPIDVNPPISPDRLIIINGDQMYDYDDGNDCLTVLVIYEDGSFGEFTDCDTGTSL
ncbi:MAG: hypothetical protein MRY78_03295 [Saprospiraceae bacterium]|nr:hypothetical protein [Saprospiraceae bacterium]